MRAIKAILYIPSTARSIRKAQEFLLRRAFADHPDWTEDDFGVVYTPTEFWKVRQQNPQAAWYVRDRDKADLVPPDVIVVEPELRRRTAAVLIPAPLAALAARIRRHPARAGVAAATVAGVATAAMMLALRDDQARDVAPPLPRPRASASYNPTAGATATRSPRSPAAPSPSVRSSPETTGSGRVGGGGGDGDQSVALPEPETHRPAAESPDTPPRAKTQPAETPPATADPPETTSPPPASTAERDRICVLRLNLLGIAVRVCL